MNTNVITPIQFRRKQVEPVKKITMLPNLFSNLLKQYKAKQDELKQKKIDFLTKEAYRYFYDLLEFPKLADVDLPEFIYEQDRKTRAYQLATKAMVDVIAEGRLNQCYAKRIEELKTKKHKG